MPDRESAPCHLCRVPGLARSGDEEYLHYLFGGEQRDMGRNWLRNPYSCRAASDERMRPRVPGSGRRRRAWPADWCSPRALARSSFFLALALTRRAGAAVASLTITIVRQTCKAFGACACSCALAPGWVCKLTGSLAAGWFTCQGKNGRQTRVCLFEASGRDHLQDGWGHLKGSPFLSPLSKRLLFSPLCPTPGPCRVLASL
jgi:hypothetical protein